MKYLLAICLCLFALPTLAGELTISEPVPPQMFEYPDACYLMTNIEFSYWAIRFNREQELGVIYGKKPKYIHSYQYQARHKYTHRGLDVTRERVPKRYLNPDYVAPTPLLQINPFCPPTGVRRYPPRILP